MPATRLPAAPGRPAFGLPAHRPRAPASCPNHRYRMAVATCQALPVTITGGRSRALHLRGRPLTGALPDALSNGNICTLTTSFVVCHQPGDHRQRLHEPTVDAATGHPGSSLTGREVDDAQRLGQLGYQADELLGRPAVLGREEEEVRSGLNDGDAERIDGIGRCCGVGLRRPRPGRRLSQICLELQLVLENPDTLPAIIVEADVAGAFDIRLYE